MLDTFFLLHNQLVKQGEILFQNHYSHNELFLFGVDLWAFFPLIHHLPVQVLETPLLSKVLLGVQENCMEKEFHLFDEMFGTMLDTSKIHERYFQWPLIV